MSVSSTHPSLPPPGARGLLGASDPVGAFGSGELALVTNGTADRMLLVVRTLIGVAALIAAPLVETLWTPGASLIGLYLLAVSGVSAMGLRRAHGAAERRRHSNVVLVADALACLAVLVLLGGTASGAGMLLFPLLAFETTLKFGNLGAALSVAGLVGGIGGRMAWRVLHYGLMPRWHLALIMIAATGVMTALGHALRARFVAEAAARAERDRIAASLRGTITELLARSGVSRHSMALVDLQGLIDLACTQPEVGRELGRRLAAALEPSPSLARLTPREAEVLGLLADGLTDRQIASRLFLSAGTIRVHVSNIMRKLGVTSRADALDLVRDQAGILAQVARDTRIGVDT
jgi:DNA-binding CsgD family transcriptional regulator